MVKIDPMGSPKSVGLNGNQIRLKHLLISILTTLIVTFFSITVNIKPEGFELFRGIFAGSGFMVLFGIWFGFWGILASGIGGFIANLLVGYSIVDCLFLSLGDFLMGAIPAIAFRYAKSDISLRDINDWMVFIIFGALTPSAGSAFSSVLFLFVVNQIAITLFWQTFLFWFTGSLVTVCLITPIFLLIFSPMMEKNQIIMKTLLN